MLLLPVQKSNERALNLRLFFFGVSWIHLIIVALVILPVDFSMDQDPKVKKYSSMRFKLITVWFNFILLAYFPVCFYCDWKEKCNQENLQHVAVLRKIRDVVFTSILFPTIMFADILFWPLYYKDVNLITPGAVFSYIPAWCQHSLHTVSIMTSVIDLCVVSRKRPKSLKPRFLLMSCFLLTYTLIVGQSYVNGHMVYTLFEVLTGFQTVLLVIISYLECSFFFILQWYVIDYIWNKPKTH
ncbi:androgen-dependent TFPI-regulating protein-like [Hyposmocoma kahamanoa]|uniref:androgen-dependent TFPI-regulating protein-like n=1 Tax=Hyposmocoma kahamanoa TaxID=1477025 RepID=UPI000E6D892A|nr:androgen-dependent TFPI-regulating protein-like [Hyposmocoma kahamanoa]